MDQKVRVVYLEWHDALSIDGWTDHTEECEFTKLALIKSCGLFVKETEDVLVLTLNNDMTNKAYSCVMIIPKSLIVRRLEIHEAIDNA